MRNMRNFLVGFVSILISIQVCSCIPKYLKSDSINDYDPAPYKTAYLTQYVDHFSFSDDRLFQQRYIFNDDWFDSISGPVFFYTGNEGNIVDFWNNTGFMFDIAPLFQALVVFCEHRYYGESLPFGNQSFNGNNVSYLTVEQALADYAVFLTYLKKILNLTDSNPIIAFGGSYGGILAAYMRFKYPNLITGSIAASAPIYLTAGLGDSTMFFRDVTNDFNKIPGCVDLVRMAFDVINKTLQQPDGYKVLSDKFKLCDPISDQAGYNHLLYWIRNAFTVMAMVDYPYPASFLGTLPAWPVNAACNLLSNETSKGTDILTAFKDLVGILYNDTSDCFDIYAQFIECADPTGCGLGNDALAWDYQACTELNTVQETNGITDMFPPMPYSNEMRRDYCKRTWNINVREEWTAIEFWGKNISSSSNIVFSNGLLDPWHNGGPNVDISDTIKAIIIDDGAHHLDLRGKNPADPESVKQARYLEIEEIIKWISKVPKTTIN